MQNSYVLERLDLKVPNRRPVVSANGHLVVAFSAPHGHHSGLAVDGHLGASNVDSIAHGNVPFGLVELSEPNRSDLYQVFFPVVSLRDRCISRNERLQKQRVNSKKLQEFQNHINL